MDKGFVETGRIVNTHGIRGQVKIEPWANSPDSLLEYRSFFIGGKEYKVISSQVHGKFVIASLQGVTDMDKAEALKNTTVYVSRSDIPLEEGEYLIGDLIGLLAVDEVSGQELGTIDDILSPPGGDVCVITGSREILVPLRPEFIKKVDVPDGHVYIRLIEGM